MRMLLCVFLTLYAATLPAAELPPDTLRRWGGTVSVVEGRVLAMDEYVKQWLKHRQSLSVDATVQRHYLPQDSDAYAAAYNAPSLAFGARYSVNDVTMHREEGPWGLLEPVDYTSRLGNILSLYGSFYRPLFRSRHWEGGYTLSLGTAYAHRKYDKNNNADNELIGSRWLIYFGANLSATYYVSPEWGVRGGVEFFHHSNGALNRPNKGANYLGPTVGLVYNPSHPSELEAQRSPYRPAPINPYWYLNVAAGVGGKTLLEDWQLTQFNTPPESDDYRRSHFRFYTAYSLSTHLMRRYALRWASGVGVDAFYGTYADRVAALDEGTGLPHSPFSLGISGHHQVFFHNLSARMSLGYYLYRHMGQNAKANEKRYYERIGVYYSLPRLQGLTLGWSIKAHATKADLTELQLVVPVRLK